MKVFLKVIILFQAIQILFLCFITLNTTPRVDASAVQDVRIVGHSGLRYDPLPVTQRGSLK